MPLERVLEKNNIQRSKNSFGTCGLQHVTFLTELQYSSLWNERCTRKALGFLPSTLLACGSQSHCFQEPPDYAWVQLSLEVPTVLPHSRCLSLGFRSQGHLVPVLPIECWGLQARHSLISRTSRWNYFLRQLNFHPKTYSRFCLRKKESEVAQLCPTLCDPMDCSLPGSSLHGILQARILEWAAKNIFLKLLQPLQTVNFI